MMPQAHKPELLVLSESNAILYEPTGREVCISVTDINDDQPPELSPRFAAVLRLEFSDIDEPSDDPDHLLFNENHAREIVAFVRRWTAADRIVIHCMAGQSRSPGIAMGLCDLFSWELGEMECRYPFWNPWVRRELIRVGQDLLQQNE